MVNKSITYCVFIKSQARNAVCSISRRSERRFARTQSESKRSWPPSPTPLMVSPSRPAHLIVMMRVASAATLPQVLVKAAENHSTWNRWFKAYAYFTCPKSCPPLKLYCLFLGHGQAYGSISILMRRDREGSINGARQRQNRLRMHANSYSIFNGYNNRILTNIF